MFTARSASCASVSYVMSVSYVSSYISAYEA